MKTLILLFVGSLLLGACGRDDGRSAPSVDQASSFFNLRVGGDVVSER